MRLGHLLKQMLLVCVFLFALTEQSIADSLSEAYAARYIEGDDAKAAKLYMPLANQGNAVAQVAIGDMYKWGQVFPYLTKKR